MNGISYEKLLESLFDGVYYVDRDKRITFWNKGAERITGFTKEEVMGECCDANILRHIDENGRELCLSGCPLSATLLNGTTLENNIYLHHKEGHRVPVSVRVSPVRDDNGKVVGGIEVFRDNSSSLQIIRELEALKQEAYLDALTGVGNRKYATLKLQTRVYEHDHHKIPFGLIFLDIDHFKGVNDTYGHAIGDDVLVMVGKTISSLLRRSDILARWGGEEFVVILPSATARFLRVIAERIRVFIEQSFIITGNDKLSVTASLGATLALPGDTSKTVIKRADSLMYASKKSGRNRVTIG